jgi:hypothetical protein
MIKILIINIAFLLLQSCSSSESSPSSSSDANSRNVDYEFNLTIDNNTYKVRGNTKDDAGFRGPVKNLCTANGAWSIKLSITDVTYWNYLSGNPKSLFLSSSTFFVKGINYLNTDLGFYKMYNAAPGTAATDDRIPVNITDLGTPSTGTLGTSDYKYGNTLKGNYTGVMYTIPAGSNRATTPHNVSFDFKAVRLY